MECKKCGSNMKRYGSDNNFDDKGNKIGQKDHYNCPDCGHDDMRYLDFANKYLEEGKPLMTRDKAREYFKSKGLDYSKINLEDIKKLSEIASEELEEYLKKGGFHAQQMGMNVRKLRVKDVKVLKKTGLQCARIKIQGSYFHDREGITFSSTGFIGFGGELSDTNIQPILKAFYRWCDVVTNQLATDWRDGIQRPGAAALENSREFENQLVKKWT